LSLTRRALLRAGGTGAVVAALRAATPVLPATTEVAETRTGTAYAGEPLDLSAVQGNSLVGFNTDHQRLLLLGLPDAVRARKWLAAVLPRIASCQQVADHAARRRRNIAEGGPAPTATWTALALTCTGLRALEVPRAELGLFPEPFTQGMRDRAGRLGDVGASAPGNWVAPFGSPGVHALLIIAGDEPVALDSLVREHRRLLSVHGVELLLDQAGDVRPDLPGHEHFGFRDGISQPGLRGVTPVSDPERPDQGNPGQDLLWPGEFVLGQPTQDPRPGPDGELNTSPGPVSTAGPAWTVNGSFLVLRRLRQDVPGFRDLVATAASQAGMAPDRLAAKLVGRWPSGAPMEGAAGSDRVDPSGRDPGLLTPQRINDFEFGADVDGYAVPCAAHIRKTYPRDLVLPTGTESATQTHRLLRRGIPFGAPYDASAPAASRRGSQPAYPDDRGLLFLCYQSSIERQFEFVQRRWVNDPDLPEKGAGPDPIISTGDPRPCFRLQASTGDQSLLLRQVVTTTGGEYFFQPSLPALRHLIDG